jgi:predicted alpha/beta-hydrolase family hydrolase
VRIAIPALGETVSALVDTPPAAPRAALVLAHGAGAGMQHPFMAAIAAALAQRGVSVLRYQFPYMERGRRRPDPPAHAKLVVRAAVAHAAGRWPGVPLFAGGKSFGGRMTSQAQAEAPLGDVRGLAFVGFPLHPAGKPSDARAAHLHDVHVPMLFLQGTHDALAHLPLLRPVVERLGRRATLEVIAGADHAFAVPARTGRRPVDVVDDLAERLAGWIAGCVQDDASGAAAGPA